LEDFMKKFIGPFIASIIMLVISVIASMLSHKNITVFDSFLLFLGVVSILIGFQLGLRREKEIRNELGVPVGNYEDPEYLDYKGRSMFFYYSAGFVFLYSLISFAFQIL